MAVTASQTTGTLTQTIPVYYEKTLLNRLEKELLFYEFADKKPLPKHGGVSIIFTRYTNFAAVTTALTEGTTPTAISLSATNVSATLAQYGRHVLVSDLLPMVAIDDTVRSAAELLGYQGGLSIDTIVRNVLSAGTEQLANAVAAVSDLATSDTLDGNEIRKAVRTLKAANVREHPKCPGFYAGLVHPNTAYDLKGDTATGSWVDVQKNFKEGAKLIETNKIGDLYGVRFWETSNLQTLSSTYQTYNNIIIGANAYAVVEIGEKVKNPRVIIKPVGSGGALDPLEQQGSIAWKATFAALLLDSTRIIVVKTGATGN